IQASNTGPPPWCRSCRRGSGPTLPHRPLRRTESAEPPLPHRPCSASLHRAAGDAQQHRPSVRGQVASPPPTPNPTPTGLNLNLFLLCYL
uniref:Uncharacterized protein n=1 Tax=Aegilops tauschii subsp. strangulata TaxID=200361 RepID=A0A453J1N9_AEGTS